MTLEGGVWSPRWISLPALLRVCIRPWPWASCVAERGEGLGSRPPSVLSCAQAPRPLCLLPPLSAWPPQRIQSRAEGGGSVCRAGHPGPACHPPCPPPMPSLFPPQEPPRDRQGRPHFLSAVSCVPSEQGFRLQSSPVCPGLAPALLAPVRGSRDLAAPRAVLVLEATAPLRPPLAKLPLRFPGHASLCWV